MIQDYSREFPCNMFTWYGALYSHFVYIIISVTSPMFCLEQITVSKYRIIYSVALNEFIASEVIIVEIVFNPQAASPAADKQRRWSQWLRSELCVSFKACNPMPRVVCRSIVSAIMSWAWEFMCIRTLSLAHSSSSWCWRRFHMSSAFVCRGSFSALTTCCSSQTPRRSVSPSSRHGRLGIESKELHVNMKNTK